MTREENKRALEYWEQIFAEHREQKKEKVRLCLRLIIFTLLLAICLAAPYLIGYNYLFLAVWASYSALIALTILDIDLLMMIMASIARFIRQKHRINE